MRRLRADESRENRSLSRFVDHALEECGLAARLQALGYPSGGLDAFRYEAMQAESDGVSLRDWVNEVCSQLRQKAASTAQSGKEIQLLTCMKAKGLEWPVVIPLGLGRAIEVLKPAFPRVQQHNGRVTVHLSALTLDGEVAEQIERERREELQRVLYVVVTRAKALLVLPDSSPLYNKSDAANFLRLAKWREFDHGTHLQKPSALTAAGSSNELPSPQIHIAPAAEMLRAAVQNSMAIPERILPHSLARDQKPGSDLDERFPITEIGGVDYGQWWHKTMEQFPWKASASERARYCESVASNSPRAFAERVEVEWNRWVTSGLHRELIDAGKVFLPETPFSFARSREAWVEGVVDLIVVTKSGECWIIDWKTDRILAAELEGDFRMRILKQYTPQLQSYGEVLERGMKRRVTRMGLYSTELGRVVE